MVDEQQHIRHVLDRLLNVVEERHEQGGVEYLGIPTGLAQVDLHTGGMQPDQMWIVGADTGGGKTSVGLDISLNAARYRPSETVIYFSLEMSAEILTNRLISRMTSVNAGRILRGMASEEEMQKVRVAAEELADLNIHIVDRTANTAAIDAYAMKVADRQPVSLVSIDYIGLLTDRDGESRTVQMGNISRAVRNLARPDKLNVPVLALSQLNRGAQDSESRRPTLKRLKDTSSLEQDANVALLLYRPQIEQQDKGAAPKVVEDAEIIIAKNREGVGGITTKARFYPQQMTWVQQ